MTPAHVLLAYDPNNIRPGWVALVLVLLLGVATYLLWRSMNTQLGRIRAPHRSELNRDGTLKQTSTEPGASDASAPDTGRDEPGSEPPAP